MPFAAEEAKVGKSLRDHTRGDSFKHHLDKK
jgi:hypothetical protein